MLTLEQIRNIRFHKAKREGYQPEEVDSFIDEIVAAFEAILSERTANKRRLESLEKELAACRERESSVGEALLSAQHQANIVIGDAQSRADLMLEEARMQARDIVAGTKGEVEEQKQIAEMLRKEVTEFKGRLMQLYREHLTLIDALPDTREGAPVAAPEAEAPVKEEVQVAETPVVDEPTAEFIPIEPLEEPEPVVAAPVAEPEQAAMPTLFMEEDEEEYAPQNPNRYNSLQFGEEYEEASRSGGFFRKKK